METGSIAKPAAVPVPSAPARAEHLLSAGAVRTELAPEAAVQQAGASEAVRFEPSRGAVARAAIEAALQEFIDRRVEIDPKAREVVFQSVDQRTGEVVRQVPDEALLRLRAYVREMQESDCESCEGTRRVAKIA